MIPNKNTRPNSYDIFINHVFFHEIYSALVNDSRPLLEDGIRGDETIIHLYSTLRGEISLYDIKILRLFDYYYWYCFITDYFVFY